MGGAEFRLRLLQPEAHVHLAVHRRGGGEMLAGLRSFPPSPVELTEPKMAVRDERTHLEFVGELHGLAVVIFCFCGRRWVTMHGNLPEKAECPSLVSLFFVRAGEMEGTLREAERIVHATGEQIRLAEPGE